MRIRSVQALVGAVLAIAGAADAQQPRMNEPAELVFGRAESETALKAEILQRIFGDESFHWSVDLEEGLIRFTGATKVVSAPVQVIGTYNRNDGTFLWGWDHPSIPEPRRADARLARQFGERHGIASFTTRKVRCTEEEAWRFTAVALYLAGAQGSYRGPAGEAGSTLVFMTFGRMTISPIR